MSNEQFWINFWKIIASLIAFIVLIIALSFQVTKYHIVRMVEAGASPTEAACALRMNTSYNNAICGVEVVLKSKD